SGRCFAFDARADGYVRAEGGAVVVLKRQRQAIADGDAIRGLVCATAVGSNGRTIGLSLLSEAAQRNLLQDTYRRAGIAAEALAFVEMHGTGTPAGDPAEAAAVGGAIGRARGTPLPIGSVKTNIGHLEAASGLAGLLKAMLALERGRLPRSLYGERPNPAIPFAALNLRIAGAAEPLADTVRYAGVNAFGFGGTVAHAVLAAPPARASAAAGAETTLPPLLISARTEESLRHLAAAWRTTLAATPAARWPPLLRAAARRRDHHPHRLAVCGADLAGGLARFLDGAGDPAVHRGSLCGEMPKVPGGGLAFIYSGNGAQFAGMGQPAWQHSAAFREGLANADAALAPQLGWSVAARIAGGLTADELRRADIAQPALFAIQVALTAALRVHGAAPSGFAGHSVGEIAASWAAGLLSLDAAARIVAVRSRHQQRTRGAGRMAALALGETAASGLIADAGVAVEIAAVNSRRSVTVAGAADAIAALGAAARQRGAAWRPLDLDFAFHSAAMDPIRPGLIADLSGMTADRPDGGLVSTVTGGPLGAVDAEHWWRNVRDPVRFADALAALIAGGFRCFLEIGPQPVLQAYLREGLHDAGTEGQVLAALARAAAPGDPLPSVAARLYAAGQDIAGAPCFAGELELRGLPLYPWQRKRYWFRRTAEAADLVNPPFDHPLLGFRVAPAETCWRNHLDTALLPWLADHRVEGTPVLPAAAAIEMALAAAHAAHPAAAALDVREVELVHPLTLGDETRETRFAVQPDGTWRLSSRVRLADEPLALHATGSLAAARGERLLPPDSRGGGMTTMPAESIYRRAARHGLDYGAPFRTVIEIGIDGARATARLAVADAAADDYLIHPTLLDGALQGMLALLAAEEPGAAPDLLLPRRFEWMRAFAPFGRLPHRAELRLTRRGARSAIADIALYDRAGAAVADLVGCGFMRIEAPRHASASEHCLRVDLVPAPLEPLSEAAVFDRIETLSAMLPGATLPERRAQHPQCCCSRRCWRRSRSRRSTRSGRRRRRCPPGRCTGGCWICCAASAPPATMRAAGDCPLPTNCPPSMRCGARSWRTRRSWRENWRWPRRCASGCRRCCATACRSKPVRRSAPRCAEPRRRRRGQTPRSGRCWRPWHATGRRRGRCACARRRACGYRAKERRGGRPRTRPAMSGSRSMAMPTTSCRCAPGWRRAGWFCWRCRSPTRCAIWSSASGRSRARGWRQRVSPRSARPGLPPIHGLSKSPGGAFGPRRRDRRRHYRASTLSATRHFARRSPANGRWQTTRMKAAASSLRSSDANPASTVPRRCCPNSPRVRRTRRRDRFRCGW
ncbi:MAG: type I polyketide synthase, partial [Alphaproteobacteria bacterium]|nr:type I polyketide synthase [Alphaproteobacteria bacterium]